MKDFNDQTGIRDRSSRISVLELRRLLVLLAENPYGICFRFRLIGQMWYPHFVRVIKTTEKGVVLNDESDMRAILVSDLKWIVQFEIDGAMHGIAPNFHYDVVADQFD